MKNNLDQMPKPCYNTYMTTKDTMTQTLALAYAQKLVAYYAAKHMAYDMDGDTITRKAYNDLCDAQNMLAYAAEMEAKELA